MGESLDPEVSQLVEEGMGRLGEENYEAAARLYRSALERCPDLAGCWHDLGIATKHLGLWEECRAVNRRALELDPSDEGAAWNLGIAATALGDWSTARAGWRAAGLSIPDGEGAPQMELGPVPIRVGLEASPEVVWCERIDPARGIIMNIPTAGCGRRHRDLVLHDGAAAGERLLEGQPVPVFNELVLLAPSAFSTYEVQIEVERPDGAAALARMVDESGSVSEDWTANMRNLCKACSEGNPDASAHGHGFEHVWSSTRRFGVATERDEADLEALILRWLGGRDRSLFQRWTTAPGRKLVSLQRVMPGAPRA